MRHGEAESKFESDQLRPLTRRGQSEAIVMADLLVNEMAPELIIASPYVRAQQTAKLVKKRFGLLAAIITWDELTPAGQPSIVLDKVADLREAEVMCVTHQPFISHFIDYLTGVETGMGTASVVAIQMEKEACLQGCGEIEWIRHRQ